VLHPQLQQVRVGLADERAWRDAQDLHDLVAVEVRAQPGQLFLAGQDGDALLQLVVGPR